MKINYANIYTSYRLLLFIALIICYANNIFASDSVGDDAFTETLCNALEILDSTIIQILSIVAIIVLAIMMLLGKLQLSTALITITGIATIFAATDIVVLITGDDAIEDICP